MLHHIEVASCSHVFRRRDARGDFGHVRDTGLRVEFLRVSEDVLLFGLSEFLMLMATVSAPDSTPDIAHKLSS